MTLVDEKVSVWADKSPVGNNAQCTTADQRPSITEDTLNGSDLVSFDGTQYLDLAKAPWQEEGDVNSGIEGINNINT